MSQTKHYILALLLFSFKALLITAQDQGYADLDAYQDFNKSRYRDMHLEYDLELQVQIDLLKKNNLRNAYTDNEFYAPLFLKKIIEQDIPYEFRYIPIIESGMRYRAQSSASASGLWQIMPKTGEWLGLKKDRCINNYYDPLASTHYATQMLGGLYDDLQDWNLVLCAYNYGIGNMKKVMKKANSRDFNDFKFYLPKETRDYVYRLHAAAYLDYIDYHQKEILDVSYSDVYRIKLTEDVKVSKLIIDYRLFKLLNPQVTCNQVNKHNYIYIIK